MKKISAFTFVELLVSISIISIITISGVYSFFSFVEKKEGEQKLNIISENLEQLDKEISSYKIFDYEVWLSTQTGSLVYITYKNTFNIPKKAMIDFDSLSYTGILSIENGVNEELWDIRIQTGQKKLFGDIKTGDYVYVGSFSGSSEYAIMGTLSGSTLNEIHIQYFSKENLEPEKNNLLELKDINTKEDKSGTSYSEISIKNIGGKKTLPNNEKELYLFFENKGKQEFIKITK